MNKKTKVIPIGTGRESAAPEALLGTQTIRAGIVVGAIYDPKLPPLCGD